MKSQHLNEGHERRINAEREGPSTSYVNGVVLKGLGECGVRITPDCRITNDQSLTASELIALLEERGWSWPRQWYRRNRNYLQHDASAVHLEKEVEKGRWIHIVVSPARSSRPRRIVGRRMVADWTLPPKDIELHAERDWLRPSSFKHLWSFVRDVLGSRRR